MDTIENSTYQVTGPISLFERATYSDLGASEKELKKELESLREDLGKFQDTLYAHGKGWIPQEKTA